MQMMRQQSRGQAPPEVQPHFRKKSNEDDEETEGSGSEEENPEFQHAELPERNMHIYCVFEKYDPSLMSLQAQFKVPYVADPVSLTSVGGTLYFAKIKVQGFKKEIKYQLAKMRVIKDGATENSVFDRTKDKKFSKLDTIFDFMDVNFTRLKQSKSLDNLIVFLLEQSANEGYPFQDANIFGELIAYLNQDGTDIRYSSLLKHIHKFLHEKKDSEQFPKFVAYIIRVFSFLSFKKLDKKREYSSPSLRELRRLLFGFFHSLLHKEQDQALRVQLQLGLAKICALNPLIALEFLDNNQVVPNPIDVQNEISKICMSQQNSNQKMDNVQHIEKNYRWILKAIPVCKNMLNYGDYLMKIIYDGLLPNSHDLNVLLCSLEELRGLINYESYTIEESTKRLYEVSKNTVKEFVRDNIQRIVQIKAMEKVLSTEVQAEIKARFLKNHKQTVEETVKLLRDCSYLITLEGLATYVGLEKCTYIQHYFRDLMLYYMDILKPAKDEKQRTDQIMKYLRSNFKNLITDESKFAKVNKLLWEFSNHVNEKVYKDKLPNFDQVQAVQQFIKIVSVSCSSFKLNEIMETLLLVSQESSKEHILILTVQSCHQILERNGLNHNICKELLCFLTVESSGKLKIKNPHFKVLVDFVLDYVAKNKDIQTNLFDDELFEMIIRIENGTNQLIPRLLKSVQDFIQKINYNEITLSEITSNIVNKKPFFEKMIKANDPQYKILEKEFQLKQSLADFNRVREMHQTFVQQANNFYLPVRVQHYQDELNIIKSNFDKITIKEAIDLRQKAEESKQQGTTLKKMPRWDLSNKKFLTLETFYHFKHSEIFPRLFKLMDTLPQQPAKKRQTMAATALINVNSNEISIEEFDQMCHTKLIHGSLNDFIIKLKQYPDQDPMSQDYLETYWNNLSDEQAGKEIDLIQQYHERLLEVQVNFKPQLKADLRGYCNLEDYFKKAQTLQSLRNFSADTQSGLYEERFNKLEMFVKFVEAIQDKETTNLKVIAYEIGQVVEIFKELAQGSQIQWEILQILQQSRDLYTFSNTCQEENFEAFIEMLDDESNITSETLQTMNFVSKYFRDLKSELEKLAAELSFSQLLIVFTTSVQRQVIMDPQFIEKIHICNANQLGLRELVDRNTNKSENTLKIINQCFEEGTIIWYQIGSTYQYDFKIEYKAVESIQDQIITEMRSQNSEQLMQHSSRAHLLIHSRKTDQSQREVIEKNVIAFTQILSFCNEVAKVFSQLQLFGKEISLAEINQRISISHDIVIDTIENKGSLIEKFERISEELSSWQNELLAERKKYYFLTYVPNNIIFQLMNLRQLGKQTIGTHILRMFKDLKMINERIQESDLEQAQEDDLFDKLHKLCTQHMIDELKQRQQKLAILFDQKKLVKYLASSTRAVFKYVSEDVTLTKAIMTVCCSSQLIPSTKDVIFCNDQTSITNLQAFIMRAMLFEQKLREYRQQMGGSVETVPIIDRAFVIANFQRLSIQKQSEIYQFIKTQENQNQNIKFSLYILSVSKDIKTAPLIEEVRIQNQPFQQYMNEEVMKKIFDNIYKNVHVYLSVYCGLGKTRSIQESISNDKSCNAYRRIPIYGDLNREKMIQRHQDKLFEVRNGAYYPMNEGTTAVHYDIYPTDFENRDLNVLMFEVMILGSISDSSGNPFYLPANLNFYVELSHMMNEKFVYLIFSQFQNASLKWNLFNIKVGKTYDDKYQRVCKYIQQLELSEKKHKHYQFLADDKSIFPVDKCLDILNRKIIAQRLKEPNYYYIENFVNFMNDQLVKLEESTYFQREHLISQMHGGGLFSDSKEDNAKLLHRDIVKNLFELTLRISIVDKFQQLNAQSLIISQNNFSKRSDIEMQASRLQDLQWDVYKNPFIVFSDDGQVTPIYQQVDLISKPLREYHKRTNVNREDYKEYDSMEQHEIIDKILDICVDPARKKQLLGHADLNNIVFTLDNMMKLVLIYMRIRASIPVLLMGETGVGKTSLIEYLSKILDSECLTMNVHAGITEEDIISHVMKAQVKARELQAMGKAAKSRKVIIFFDEINTSTHIQGIFKEIFVDRHLLGEKLCDNIAIVSACNPLKQRKAKMSQLTQGFNKKATDETKTDLVYRVELMPESMVPSIWDFNTLSQKDERKYIEKMLTKTFETQSIQGSHFSLVKLWIDRDPNELSKVHELKRDVENITDAIQNLQQYIKVEEDSPWAVSLRDVSRFCKLLVYFNQTTNQVDHGIYLPRKKKRAKNQFRRIDVALALATYFCYVIRMSTKEKRDRIIDALSHYYTSTNSRNPLSKNEFFDIIENEQKRVLEKMAIPAGIGKNYPLKENVFVIINCILNQIPLIITGKPGSSKTLAMNLVLSSFKGKLSTSDYFKQFPKFLSFYYQGSEQSTSKGIERIYKKAHDEQEKVSRSQRQVVVVFDEIGLAENASTNPLKVMHSLLEPPRVATVGLSNYSLDASKMNRVINLQRTEPGDEDLVQSAKSISGKSSIIFQERYLQQLVKWYCSYMVKQNDSEKFKNFHGLRDFYSMIKFISPRIKSGDDLKNETAIIRGIKRNFGGANYVEAVAKTLQEVLEISDFNELRVLKPDELIRENIQEQNPLNSNSDTVEYRKLFESRHLMIITDNQDSTLQFIQDICQLEKKAPKIFYGSDFPEDLNEDSTYKLINQIIMQMEQAQGSLCVFLNLNEIQQYFFDMLNQNYQEVGTQRFCKVAIGADSSRCLVNKYFRCILVVDHKAAYKLDAPLLNRFEKQLYTEDQSLDAEMMSLVKKLENWIASLQISSFNKRQMFPTIDERQSLQQIVILCKELYGNKAPVQTLSIEQRQQNAEKIEYQAKQCLINVATFSGIIRSQLSLAKDKKEWYDDYLQDDKHIDLKSLLNYYKLNWHSDPVFTKDQGFNLIVYTHSAMLSTLDNDLGDFKVQVIKLNSIAKKEHFDQSATQFFESKENELLIVFADMLNDSKTRINMCRSTINNIRLETSDSRMQGSFKHVIFIIRITQSKDEVGVSFGRDWRQYTLDMLNGTGNTTISMKQLISCSLEQLVLEGIFQDQIFEAAIIESVSKIQYNRSQNFIKKRIVHIQQLFQDKKNSTFLKELVHIKLINSAETKGQNTSWIISIAKNEFLMKSYLTFHGAALKHIKSQLVKYLSFIIFNLEQDSVIMCQDKDDLFEKSKKFFKKYFEQNYAHQPNQDMFWLQPNFDKISFPLAKLINEEFIKLRTQYLNILKEQNQQLNLQISKNLQKEKQTFALLSPEERKQYLEQEKYRRLIIKDKELDQNIQSVSEWCVIYCPDEEFKGILNIRNDLYLNDFSYLLLQQILSNENSNHDESSTLQSSFQTFIKESLLLLMKGKLESKAHIYGIYWKCENLLSMVWKIIGYNIDRRLDFFEFKSFIARLIGLVTSHKLYVDPEIKYLPREVYLECIMTVFFEVYYPSHANISKWQRSVQQTFLQLNNIMSLQANVFRSNESRFMIFLLNFWKEILQEPEYTDRQEIFINFAADIKSIFNNPQQIVEKVVERRELLISKLVSPEKQQKQYTKILKFIFEHLIECSDLNQKVSTSFFLNQLITLLVTTSPGKGGKQLQYHSEFQNSLPKLMGIALSRISESMLLSVLCSQRDYTIIVSENEELKTLHSFINNHSELKVSDPILVILNDTIEKKFEDKKTDEDEETIQQKLIEVKRIVLTASNASLQMNVAIAYFKRVAKIFANDILIAINEQEEDYPFLQAILEEFFNEKAQENKDKLYPLCIYIIKLLHSKKDMISKYIPHLIFKNPWIKDYVENLAQKAAVKDIKFPHINDPQFEQAKQTFIKNQGRMEDFFKEIGTDPIKRMGGLIQSFESTYLKQYSIIPDQNLLKYLNHKKDDKVLNESTMAYQKYIEEFIKPLLSSTFSGRTVKAEGRDHIFDLLHNQQPYYGLLIMFMGAASFSSDTFIQSFLRDPYLIQNCYLPFIQDFKVHEGYQSKIQQTKDTIKICCQACKSITLAIQLPAQQKKKGKKGLEQEKQILLGEKVCLQCVKNKFNVKGSSQFTGNKVDIEAEKSYIPLEKLTYNEIRVRDLSIQELSLGRILVHSLLMLILVFADSNVAKEIMKMVGVFDKQQEYQVNFQNTMKYLGKGLSYDWSTLQTLWCVNEEKVLQVIQSVIIGMVKESSKFHIEYLRTTDQRRTMEGHFKEIINRILSNKDKFFRQNVDPTNKIELLLLELIDFEVQTGQIVSPHSIENLLRVKIPVSLKQLEMLLQDQQMKGTDFFKILFEQKHAVQSIKLIKPLINWANFVSRQCYAQITLEEAKELTIKDIINKETARRNFAHIEDVKKQYRKFEEAWNTFAELIIKDDNVEAVIPTISEDSPIIYCCLSQTCKDHEGYILFLLLKYLALLQNNLIHEAEKMMKSDSEFKNQSVIVNSKGKQIKDQESETFPKTTLLELKKDQIIYFRERSQLSKKDANQNKSAKMTEKEKLEDIIIKNSICKYEYGQGKIIEYNFTTIKRAAVELLLQGKYLINLDGDTKIHFQFVNVGNLYNLVRKILSDSVQEVCPQTREIVKLVVYRQDAYSLYLSFKIAINFLYQSLPNPEDRLLDFLGDYEQKQFQEFTSDLSYANDLKIKHFIHIFEGFEKVVAPLFIEEIHDNFRKPLPKEQKKYFSFILGQNYWLINPILNALQKYIVRFLSLEKPQIQCELPLLEVLFDVKNWHLFADTISSGHALDFQVMQIIFQECLFSLEHALDVFRLLQELSLMYKQQIKHNKKEKRQKQQVGLMLQRADSLDTSLKLKEVYQLIKSEFEEPKKSEKNDNEYLIEEFFIIGEDLSPADLQEIGDQDNYVGQKTLYQFRQKDLKADCPKRAMVKVFCFPSGVKVNRLSEADVARMTSGPQSNFTKEQSFVFTINNQGEKGYDSQKDQFIYCLCVIRDELLIQEEKQKLNYFMTQRAYCVMSVFKYYDFHLQLLNSVLNIQKIQQFHASNKEKQKNPKLKDHQADALALLHNHILSKEAEGTLQPYFTLKAKSKKPVIADAVGFGEYGSDLSQATLQQKKIQDMLWQTPTFLRMLKPEQFFYIWQVMLLEQPILFIADDLTSLTSASIGMQCFLDPLSWQNPQIPILSDNMGDYLLSPIPMLAGILRPSISKFDSEIIEHIDEEALIVDIKEDKSGVEITHKNPLKHSQMHLFNYLLENLTYPFQMLKNPEISSEQEIQQQILKIFELVNHSLKINVIYKIPLPILEGRRKELECKVLQEAIIANCNVRDREFVEQVVRTQMMTYYLECNYCSEELQNLDF